MLDVESKFVTNFGCGGQDPLPTVVGINQRHNQLPSCHRRPSLNALFQKRMPMQPIATLPHDNRYQNRPILRLLANRTPSSCVQPIVTVLERCPSKVQCPDVSSSKAMHEMFIVALRKVTQSNLWRTPQATRIGSFRRVDGSRLFRHVADFHGESGGCTAHF